MVFAMFNGKTYGQFHKVILFDPSRNRMIVQDAIKMLDAVNKVMILTDPIILLS